MRATIILLLLGATIGQLLMAGPLMGQIHLRKIDFTATDMTLYAAIKKLEKEQNLDIAFDERLLGLSSRTVANKAFKTTSIEQVLRNLFAGTQVVFEENERGTIILKKAQRPGVLTGVVLDEHGEPLPSATVRIAELNRTATTNEDGRFTLSVRPGSYTVVASYISFESMTKNEVLVEESGATTLTFQLKAAVDQMDEVVVTALGIKREEKALGYSMSTLSGEELTNAMSANWTDALTGKVAGLNIVKSGAGPAGTNQIILRGETSLTGDNSALIVVDGVVISGASGQMTSTGFGNYLSDDSPVDFGNSISDLNPDDIESISILKGPAASALYGFRGSGGAVVITTKQGSKQKGLGVNFTSNSYIGLINRWPDYQYEYGQGAAGQDLYYSYGQTEDGSSTFSTSSAWGPKFDGQMFYQYNPEYHRLAPTERTLWQPYKNNRKDFFDVSQTFTNSLSISGGGETTKARLNYTNTHNKWIVPNTGFDRHAISLNLNHNLSQKLSVATTVTYNIKESGNLPTTGYNNQTIMYFIRGLTPNMDIDNFREYWRPGEEGIRQTKPYSNLLDNPFLIAHEMLNTQKRNNLIGNASANYKFNDMFNLMVRSNLDWGYDERSQRRPFDSNQFAQGYYRETNVMTREINNEFMFRYDNREAATFKHGIYLGGSMMSNRYVRDDLSTRRLSYPNVYNFANAADLVTYSPARVRYAVNSIYSLANISYKDFLFLDGTLRVDWASTLASPATREVRPFAYYSLNSSTILSEAFQLPEAISFWKLRGSAALVGSGGTRAYLNSYTYPIANNFPGGLVNPREIPSEDLKYESTMSYELGTDIRLFRDRLNFDITAYSTSMYDQILQIPVDPSSGYTTEVVNAGKVTNRGIELGVSGKPIVKKDGFSWTVNANFTAYDSKVVNLPDSVQSIVLSTVFGSRGTVEARVGGFFGDLYGLGYERAPDGSIIYQNGLPQVGEELMFLGNANANIKVGVGNEFTYKNFKFNFLFDGQFGGVGYSLTHAVLMEEGKLNKTIPGRYNGIIGHGVVDNGDGTYVPNTTVAPSARDYYHAHYNRDNLEANTFSTDFIKLREARIDYTLPTFIANRLKVQRAVVGLYGRDLFVFSNWPAFDPEFGSLNASGIEKGAEIGQFPSTRTFGINLAFGF